MNPRLLLILFLVLQVSVSLLAKTNILLICVDDLKPAIGAYGDKLAKTPNIDRLAARGMLFTRAYCNQAVCSPSRNALLTGMRPTSSGIYDLGTNFRKATPDAVTLPQFFKQNGYRAEGMGKIFHVGHGNDEDPESWSVPFKKGRVVEYANKASAATNELTREEAFFANDPRNVSRLPRGAPYENADVPDNAYTDGKLAEEAIRRLQKAKADPETPFFLAVGFVKPHLPFCAPKKYWDMHDRASFKLPNRRTPPDGAPPYAPQFGGELRQYREAPPTGPLDEELQIKLIHGYYAATSYMDAQLGRVLDELDRLGLAQNTLIIFWGDHGWHLGDHGIWCKHTNYEQAARIPLIIAAPGVKPGSRSDALVESVDLYPTIRELTGFASKTTPQKLDGASLANLLHGKTTKTKEAIFHCYPRAPRGKGELIGRAVRTERYRLVEWKKAGAPADTAELELYDYKDDPEETVNLSSTKPAIVAELREILNAQPEAKPQWRAAKK